MGGHCSPRFTCRRMLPCVVPWSYVHPLAKEHISAYRGGLRQLAQELAEHGFLALRFDYEGQGDSSGRQDDPLAVAHWQASVTAAVSYVRRTGIESVAVAGLRAGGALLAASTVDTLGDLRAMVLWDPVISGRAYVRELTSLYRVSVDDDPHHDDCTSIVGGLLASAAVNDLSGLDLSTFDPSSSTKVLAAIRPEFADSPRVVRMLERSGAERIFVERQNQFVSPPAVSYSRCLRTTYSGFRVGCRDNSARTRLPSIQRSRRRRMSRRLTTAKKSGKYWNDGPPDHYLQSPPHPARPRATLPQRSFTAPRTSTGSGRRDCGSSPLELSPRTVFARFASTGWAQETAARSAPTRARPSCLRKRAAMCWISSTLSTCRRPAGCTSECVPAHGWAPMQQASAAQGPWCFST